MGGEITWRCDGNGAFIFRTKLYRDCNGVNGPSSMTLQSNSPVTAIQCSLISQTDITPQGIGCASCSNPMGLPNSVEEFVYESGPIQLNGTPPASGWYFSYSDCCRNQAIVNLSSGNGWFTLRAIMYPFSGQNTNPCYDNSPVFAEPPTLGLCTSSPLSYNHAKFLTPILILSLIVGEPL